MVSGLYRRDKKQGFLTGVEDFAGHAADYPGFKARMAVAGKGYQAAIVGIGIFDDFLSDIASLYNCAYSGFGAGKFALFLL